MWNLRKAPIAGIEAGSTFVFKLAEDAVINKEFVGERNLEGYGNIKIINLDSMPYKLLLVENKNDKQNNIEFNLIKPIINKVIINSICEKLKNYINERIIKISADIAIIKNLLNNYRR